VTAVRRRGHLLTALAQPGFRRLFGVRLLGQFGDGVFQASLAGAVLFNPERQAHAADVAAAFAVLLVPYSIVGPFAGVLLDRWRRQRVLLLINVLRGVGVALVATTMFGGLHGQPFYACALVIVSMNRFVLSALSASLPHVVRADDLVTANALSSTSGTIATTVGGAAAIGVRAFASAGSNTAYGAMALAAAIPYLASAVVSRWFAPDDLGPDDVERGNRETVAEVARGLVDGARHVRARRPVFIALIAIGVHRLCYGVSTVCTVLLYRNYFHSNGVFRAGIGGLGQVVAAVAIGGGIAALVTPVAARRLGYVRWPAALFLGAAVVEVALGLPYSMPLVLLGALLLGVGSQGIKICVDTLVQQDIEDEYRGRVFTIYDTLFNLTLVAAAVITAVALPDNGRSPISLIVIAVAYAATAVGYLYAGASRSRARTLTDAKGRHS